MSDYGRPLHSSRMSWFGTSCVCVNCKEHAADPDDDCSADSGLTVVSRHNGTTWNVQFDWSKGSRTVKTIHFYDADQDADKFGPLGQFVAEYDVDTIIELGDNGLNLMGGVPRWQIDGEAMSVVSDWALRMRDLDVAEDNNEEENDG